MTREEHLLIRAMEECNEVAQRISKALVFGLEQVEPDTERNPHALTNRDRIYEEYYQLRAVLGMAGIDAWDSSPRARIAEAAKVEKVERFLIWSQECGTLAEPAR